MSLARLPSLGDRRTASDHVAEVLREAIVNGQFEDGEELNQVDLANHFRVSRVPVREALHRLQAEGLVHAEAHRRAIVIGFNRERIAEIFDIRALLETYVLERSAPNLREEDLRQLSQICDQMDAAGDHDRWLEGNRAFHRALLAPSGMKTALLLIERLSQQVERYLRRSGGVHRREEVDREHRAIIQLLERRDVAKARQVLRRHIQRTRERALTSLPEPPGQEVERRARPAI
jgi:DNA-binding GntR family transcriptional regulator